jgi:hypothetical protein
MTDWKLPVSIAAAMFAVELILGIGVLGGSGFFIAAICILIYYGDGRSWRALLRTALVFALLGLVTLLWINLNWRIAERRAIPLATACDSFRLKNGHYPKSLDQLVPTFLPAIPSAKLTVVGSRFGYSEDPPSLYFAVMFHGVATYHLESQTWSTND